MCWKVPLNAFRIALKGRLTPTDHLNNKDQSSS